MNEEGSAGPGKDYPSHCQRLSMLCMMVELAVKIGENEIARELLEHIYSLYDIDDLDVTKKSVPESEEVYSL